MSFLVDTPHAYLECITICQNVISQSWFILLRAQWPFTTYLYIAGLWAYLQKFYKVKIYETTYW